MIYKNNQLVIKVKFMLFGESVNIKSWQLLRMLQTQRCVNQQQVLVFEGIVVMVVSWPFSFVNAALPLRNTYSVLKPLGFLTVGSLIILFKCWKPGFITWSIVKIA